MISFFLNRANQIVYIKSIISSFQIKSITIPKMLCWYTVSADKIRPQALRVYPLGTDPEPSGADPEPTRNPRNRPGITRIPRSQRKIRKIKLKHAYVVRLFQGSSYLDSILKFRASLTLTLALEHYATVKKFPPLSQPIRSKTSCDSRTFSRVWQ